MTIIILFISLLFVALIIAATEQRKLHRRIKQLEHDLKNLEEHTDEFRKKYNDGKKMPPKFPNGIYN